MSINSIFQVPLKEVILHDAYLQLVNENGRARILSETDLASQNLRINDIAEAKGIIQLYLNGINLAVKSLAKGDLEKFDAILGDHNCQNTAEFALSVFCEYQSSAEIKNEALQLAEFAKQHQGKVNIKQKKNEPPVQLIREAGFEITLSQKMKYLVCCAILKCGTECIERRNGGMTLRVNPQTIQQKIGKSCSLDLISRLITPLREYINTSSVEHVQQVAKSVLKKEEIDCLQTIKIMKTPRGEIYKQLCAFYSVKATLLNMARRGIPFAVVQYNLNKITHEHPLLFTPIFLEESELPFMKSLGFSEASELTPFFVIQVFFNETFSVEKIDLQLQEYGLVEFILASIATCPQFVDMDKKDYSNNEDIQELLPEIQNEILLYRDKGKKLFNDPKNPPVCTIAHTYADVFKNICKGQGTV